MAKLADTYLSREPIATAGLLDYEAVQALRQRHQAPTTPMAERVQLDAVINHLLSVQILHQHFVAPDLTQVAQEKAAEIGWTAPAPSPA